MAQLMTETFKCLGLAIAATVLMGCPAENATPNKNSPEAMQQAIETGASTPGGDSPEAVHQALVDAVQAEDWRRMAGYVTPETHDTMTRSMMKILGLMTMSETYAADVVELYKRHGIPMTDEGHEPAAPPPRVTGPLSTDLKLSYQTPASMRRANDLAEVQAEPRLFATVILDGKPALEASRVGFLRVDAARDDQGKRLAPLKTKHFELDVDGDFVDVNAAPFQATHPRPLRVDLIFERPSTGAKSLALLEGSLTLVTGGRAEEVTIRDIRSIKQETVIENEIFKRVGVTLKLRPVVSERNVQGSVTGPVWSIDVVDGQGKRVAQCVVVAGDFAFLARAPLPADTALRVVVLTGQKPETSHFRFADLPLPVEGQEAPEQEPLFVMNEHSEENLKKMIASIKDKAAFLADMVAMITKTQGQQVSYDSGELTDLKIEGSTAKAVRVINQRGPERREPIEFRKIDGRWYVHQANIRLHPARRTPPSRPK